MSEKKQKKTMSRKDFLKVTGLGALGLFIASKVKLESNSTAEDVKADSAVSVTDNLGKGSIVKSATAPANKSVLWLNTSGRQINKVAANALAYYANNEWLPVTSVWM